MNLHNEKQAVAAPENVSKLGILAGKGELPRQLMQACREAGRPYCLLAFEDSTPSALVEGEEHIWTRLGAVGEALDALRARGVETLVLAGRIERPKLSTLRPDGKGARLLAKLGTSLFAGDDRLLRTITQFLEEEGFSVIGADELLDKAVTPAGQIGRHAPSPQDRRDMAKGWRIARLIGAEDIGQAVIVQAEHVIGVEALEGTDELIRRCASLKQEEAGGVLVKAKKPSQERRADLPAIGPETVRRMQAAGFAGIALEAGGSLIIDRDATIAAADEAGLFLFGIEPERMV